MEKNIKVYIKMKLAIRKRSKTETWRRTKWSEKFLATPLFSANRLGEIRKKRT